MSMDEMTKLLDAVTKLVATLAWPGLAAFVLIRFGEPLHGFFQNLNEFSFKGAGFEATAKRQVEAAAALAAATAKDGAKQPGDGPATTSSRSVADVVTDGVTPRVLRKASSSTILWVDDRPENNVYERRSLEALGIRFVLATSTEEALDRLKLQRVDAIISDMGRPPDGKAGYTLLAALRARGDKTPYVIYAGSAAPEHDAEARRNGALGSTNRPVELFDLVLSALRAQAL